MKCLRCEKEPEWHDFPAPSGWVVKFRGFPFETWTCDACYELDKQQDSVVKEDLTTIRCAGIITGEGYDDEWSRRITGRKSELVYGLSGKNLDWHDTVPTHNGRRAPTAASLNDPARRREFYKRNPQFEESSG